ncbi:MAG: NUDIX domain-containing protein [Thermoanaerobaculia bacterium]|nr:NUDIX domain-containing protein [Thermoanaerobaculia bacterium]
MSDEPVFGRKVRGSPYVVRPSAYALVFGPRGELAVVQTSIGCFLPGGGIEENETPEQAVEREAMEECGFRLRVGKLVGRATEIVHSARESSCFEKPSSFFSARLLGLSLATENGSEVRWLELERAAASLAHGSHRWAVCLVRGATT